MSIASIDDLPQYTYDDFQQWEGDWELIEGVPYSMVPSPVIIHQGIASNIVAQLVNSLGDCMQCMVLHEQDWKISESTTVRPDVVLVCNERGDAYITQHPEIIFEVVSKSSIKLDEALKFKLYAAEKVPYYIIVYPNDLKAKVFKLTDEHYVKVADTTNETVNFDDLPCKVSADFGAVFKRFRAKS